MTIKIAVSAVLSILSIGTILAIFPALDVLSEKNLDFCLSSGCFTHAADIFSESISIIKTSSLIAAYIAAMFGSYIGLRTFNQTIARDHHTRHTNNLSSFKAVIEENIKSSDVPKECLNINKLYQLIYPNSESGDTSVSKRYTQTIIEIQACVQLTSFRYASGNPSSQGVRPEHEPEILELFERIGLTVQDPYLERIVELEPYIFTFLDKINASLTSIPEKLADIRRDYTVAFGRRR